MKEKSILHEIGNYWVSKKDDLFLVFRSEITHSVSVDNVGYSDLSLAVARANYLANRELRA